jgi:GTP cyclohydrolase II
MSLAAPADEPHLRYSAACELPTPWGTFQLHAFVDRTSGEEHLALTMGNLRDSAPVLARIHSECLTGDVLFSERCDCGPQLRLSLERIANETRGILLYMRQEGRGIGLINKLRAYRIQEAGFDTVDANEILGLPVDGRDYGLCRPMLRHFGIGSLRLMTNNPRKIEALQQYGFEIAERIPLTAGKSVHNERYLQTKAARLGHLF